MPPWPLTATEADAPCRISENLNEEAPAVREPGLLESNRPVGRWGAPWRGPVLIAKPENPREGSGKKRSPERERGALRSMKTLDRISPSQPTDAAKWRSPSFHWALAEAEPQCPTKAPSVIALSASDHLWK